VAALDNLQSQTFEVSEDPESVFEFTYEEGWTDGLPIIPPTAERLERVFAATSLEPAEVVGKLEPRRGEATVEKIAINAVMAGCRPEYMSVLISAVRALARPEFNLNGIQSTTNPVAPLMILNGPVRREIEVNCVRGALGQGTRANATIGRALRLLMMNVGSGLPETVDKAILGMPAKYSFCLGEDEENSPWDPLHVERGLLEEQSAVTVVGVASLVNNLLNIHPELSRPEPNLLLLADAMAQKGSNNIQLGGGNPVVVLPSGLAQMLHDAGYSKDDVKSFLWEHAAFPEEEMPEEMRFTMGHPAVVERKIYPCERAGDIIVLVAGGPEPYHAMYMPNFGETEMVTEMIG
jgi:hypothetical protein